MRLILVRHGETDHNRDGIVQGRADNPLSESGRRQVEALARHLTGHAVDAIYASPLRRAFETAELLGARLGAAVYAEPGLIEMDVGEMDGLTIEEVRERFGEFLVTWRQDESGRTPLPGGESMSDVQRRAWSTVERIEAAHPQGTAVLVSHQFTLQAIMTRVLDAPLMNFERFRFHPATATVIVVRDGRRHVERFNVRCGLPR